MGAANITRGVNNNAFSPNPDLVAQITGSGAPLTGFNGATTIGAGFAPTYAAAIEIGPFIGNNYTRWVDIVTNSTVGNATVNSANFVPPAGGCLWVAIDNDATAARTITFGTNFRSTGTVVGTNSKQICVAFVSNGTSWCEFARSSSAV
jgi:hypothetical protein